MSNKTTSPGDGLHSEKHFDTIRVAARGGRRASLLANATGDNAIVGEVKVKVKLTNAVDEALVRRGLLTADKVRSYEADALVDTGAIRSVFAFTSSSIWASLPWAKQGRLTRISRVAGH
jgi:hypothetical protein